MRYAAFTIATALLVLNLGLDCHAAIMTMHRHSGMMAKDMMVAYDAKDKRYYSVAYAKAHNMHDRGGDPLTIVPLSSLPPTAKMSRAMHGHL